MNEPFGVYIHWPFCLSKCPYCDFNSHAAARIDQERWRKALETELAHAAARTRGRTVTSLFFGGGTPSLMDPATAAALIDAAARHWTLAEDIEISLEANPGTVDAARFTDFRAAGINRLSLGIQALDDDALRALGRIHDLDDAVRAIELARAIFPRLSFDLIYARPDQELSGWREELALALALAGEHLSLYQLSLEPGTPFFTRHEAGLFPLPDDDRSAALYDMTQEMCAAAGLPAYEISNHARPGSECRGNLLYWQGGEYAGIGPGAHGRLRTGENPRRIAALRQESNPDIWLNLVESRGHGTAEETPLTPKERVEELVMMGLRLTEGIETARFFRQTGLDLEHALNRSALKTLSEDGLLDRTDRFLRVTAQGRLLLNTIISALLD